jgi:hypothetical protein
VCLDPEKHGYARKGHNSYVSPQAQAEQARRDAEQAARIEALKAAEEVRHNFLAKTYGNTKSKAAKAMLTLALRQAAHDPSRLSIGHSAGPLVTRIAGTDPDTIDTTTSVERVNRVLIARYVLSREADLMIAMRWGDRAETALKWQDLLVSDGYELSDAENALRDKLLDRLKPGPEPRTTTSDLNKPCNECGAEVDEECEEECELFHAEPDDQEPDDQDAAQVDPDAAQAEPQPGDEQAEQDQ